MTRDDPPLDVMSLLKDQTLTLYRIVRAKYANLSGIGAALFPGHWNRPGQEAIYTSTEIGVALAEVLAHTSKDLIPSNLALMTIRIANISDPQTRSWVVNGQPNNGCLSISRATTLDGSEGSRVVRVHAGTLYFYRTLAEAKDDFVRSDFSGLDPVGLAVPSVIAPVWNVVLYPQAKTFWNLVSLESVESFEFDPRLFPEDAPVEAQGPE